MKKLLLIACMLLIPCLLCAKTKITPQQYSMVMNIAKENDVPLSVARQLMKEESVGYVDAVSPVTSAGYISAGLFQLYMCPDNIDYLLTKFWKYDKHYFDVNNPEHNAVVAMKYLNWLHKWYGSWYKALIYYNHGSIYDASEQTKAYARRIINAR